MSRVIKVKINGEAESVIDKLNRRYRTSDIEVVSLAIAVLDSISDTQKNGEDVYLGNNRVMRPLSEWLEGE